MKKVFEKQKFNEAMVSESEYIEMFAQLGFNAQKVQISFTNGCSAYITVYAKVLNAGKMYYDTFVYDGVCTLQVRVSDHSSNLERICGGVAGNTLSFEAFKSLVEKGVIKDNSIEA